MLVNWTEIVAKAMSARPVLELPRNFKLPCVPQSVIEFTAISKDLDAGPKELAAPIEVDAVLTSGLLRQVNSAATGLRQPVVSVKQAINLLGPRRTKTLVLTVALQAATSGVQSRLINITQFQNTNRMRAVFARHAALAIGADAEAAYLAGLLQDFLLPMLSEAFYADYVEILRKDKELVLEEQARFGWNHAQISAGLMFDWGFPEELIACVLMHHDGHVSADQSLRGSSVGATVASAALPDRLAQSPTGFETLVDLQNQLPNFNFLEIAGDVDLELNRGELIPGQHGLQERLVELAEASLEGRRVGQLHQHGQLGSYILETQIGEGAMGMIYLARHCMLKRSAAIKVLRSGSITPTSLALFETEVQLTCQLTSPHTVSVYDYGVTPEGLFYYAMEYLDGVTLAQLVREVGPLPVGRVIHFLTQICASLVEAHGLGLIHRDLKPENVMICNRGGVPDTVKVLDFGIATVISNSRQGDQVDVGISGTPCFMSPEAITSPQDVDFRSDIYSIGGIAYFLLTGHTLFDDPNINAVLKSQLFDVPVRPSERLGKPIDADLEEIVLRCLAKPRHQRPTSAVALSKLLSQCIASGSWNPHDAVPIKGTPAKSPGTADTADASPSDTIIVKFE